MNTRWSNVARTAGAAVVAACIIAFCAPPALAQTPAPLGSCRNPLITTATAVPLSQYGQFAVVDGILGTYTSPIGHRGVQTGYGWVNYTGHYCKQAFILFDWGDRGWTAEANNLAAQLRASGEWNVTLFDSTYLQNNLSEIETFMGTATPSGSQLLSFGLLQQTRAGDQILIDLEAHGAEAIKTFTLDNGAVVGPETYSNALDDPQVVATQTSITYPFPDVSLHDYYDTHWTSANISLGDVVTRIVAQTAGPVTFIDHSCFGGSTAMRGDLMQWPNICFISTDGVMTPGLVGYPATSGYWQSQVSQGSKFTMNDLADWMSQLYDADNRAGANRTQSRGYKTGCNQTLPLRDTLALFGNEWTTWWDWNQNRPSFVVRQPGSFANGGPWWKIVAPIPNNPHMAVPAGWSAFFQQALSAFVSDNLYGTWVVGQGLSGEGTTSAYNQQVISIMEDGLALENMVSAWAAAIDALDADLEASSIQGMTVDTYLRNAFISQCSCGEAIAEGSSCPPAPPGGFADGRLCYDPTDFVAWAMAQSPNGAQLAQDFATVQFYDQSPDVANMANDIAAFESGCVSPACAAQNGL
jgi:hypothetical protein